LNFLGSGVSVVDGGGNEAEVTIPDRVTFSFFADQMDNPNNANWVVNALAPAVADTLNPALTVRRFDDTIQEGVGFILRIPPNRTFLRIREISRGQVAPGTAQTVRRVLYRRTIPDNAAVTAWSSGFLMDTIGIPTNTNFQYDQQEINLSTLGLTAGNLVQFEFTRLGSDAGDTLTGDWALLQIQVEFD
jgi:hypothetical protein